MRKKLTLLLSLLFLFSAAPSFFAGTDFSETSSFELSVNYTNNCVGVSAAVEKGETAGQLPDGTDFTAVNLPKNAVSLRIYPIQPDETEVNAWIESCLTENLKKICAYHVSCTDETGAQISPKGAVIGIGAPKDAGGTVLVYALSTDGTLTALDVVDNGGVLSFTATDAPYYVFCLDTENPSSSDENVTMYYVFLVTVLALVVTVLVLTRRKEEI